jgi:hypothetical protein
MDLMRTCPECGADWPGEETCQAYFHRMLYWEHENPAYGAVHHLMVLSYHLQHPSLYSPEGLREALYLLAEFLERGLTPAEVRKRSRARVDSSRRRWKIKGTSDSPGRYEQPIRWTMTAAEVVAAGSNRYCNQVKAWAQSILESLRASENSV